MGTNRSASIRDTVRVLRNGTYTISVRYQIPNGSARMYLIVNGKRNSLTMRATNGVWAETSVEAELEAGENEVELKFVSTPVNVLVDCIKINRDNAYVYDFEDDKSGTSATDPAAEMLTDGRRSRRGCH